MARDFYEKQLLFFLILITTLPLIMSLIPFNLIIEISEPRKNVISMPKFDDESINNWIKSISNIDNDRNGIDDRLEERLGLLLRLYYQQWGDGFLKIKIPLLFSYGHHQSSVN